MYLCILSMNQYSHASIHTFDRSMCLCIIHPLYLSPYLFLIISLRASSISSAIFILCCYTINSHRRPTYYPVSSRSSVCIQKRYKVSINDSNAISEQRDDNILHVKTSERTSSIKSNSSSSTITSSSSLTSIAN